MCKWYCLIFPTHNWCSIWGNGETYLSSNGSDGWLLPACPCWVHWTLQKDSTMERIRGSKHWTQNREGSWVQCQWKWIYLSDWAKRPVTCRVRCLLLLDFVMLVAIRVRHTQSFWTWSEFFAPLLLFIRFTYASSFTCKKALLFWQLRLSLELHCWHDVMGSYVLCIIPQLQSESELERIWIRSDYRSIQTCSTVSVWCFGHK